MSTDIILIGPAGVGKSTIAALLAERLKLRLVSLDVLRWEYYSEIGYDEETARKIHEEQGFWAMYQYWKPFELHSVERVLQEYSRCVIEFGAGHSVYEDDVLFQRAKQALGVYKNVVLLLPSPDKDESYRILNERYGEEFPINKHFLTHHSNYDLATLTVYNKDQTPEQTVEEILQRIHK